MPKIYMRPVFRNEDAGRGGGIRRVVEAQHKYLPDYGFSFVDQPDGADILALHGGDYIKGEHGQLVASHCHGLYWNEYSWNKWEYELNANVIKCLKQADLITSPSEWVSNTIRRGMWATVHTVPNGIDTSEWTPLSTPPASQYILWNKSRVDPICEIDSLVQLAQIDQNHTYVSTMGPDKNIPANMRITGVVDYATSHEAVRNASVYLATTRETFGIGTLEALACGVPIVGWAWGGQREFVQHKIHGWLCTPGDVESLREGVDWCLSHADSLRANCIELAKQYEWPGVVEQYANLYTQTLTDLSKPTVRCSIVISSYNLRKYLPEAVQSAVKQKCDGDYEVIIVDDNSTDDSYELALSLAADNKRVRVLKTPKNLYLAGALNYAISQARGEYILCLDADNILPANTLNILSSTLDTDRTLDIVYGRVQFITESGVPDPLVSPDGISPWPLVEFSYDGQMNHKNQIPSTCLYRKKVWQRIGGYRGRCRTAEDADFWCRATSYGFTPKKVSNMVTLIYRNRENSMSMTNQDWPWEAWYTSKQPPMAISNVITTNEPTHISVIIPVGPHHTELVQDALDSLNAQTFKNWECIVVNDSDRHIPWLPSWAKEINTGGNVGVSTARNVGIAAAKGVCFLPLDADDFLDPTCLEKMWAAWLQHKGYVYSDFFVSSPTVPPRKVSVGADACKHVLEMLPHPVTALYPIQAWKDAGGFNKNLKVGEDWVFVASVTLEGYCGTYIPEGLIYYRTDVGGNREALLQPENLIAVQSALDAHIKLNGQEAEKMACGCKRGGGTVMDQVQSLVNNMSGEPASPNTLDLVKIEMYAPDIHNQRYVGRATQTAYIFASEGKRQAQYVHKSDAEYFVGNLGHIFRYVDVNSPVVVSV